jgi:hypothetical protein
MLLPQPRALIRNVASPDATQSTTSLSETKATADISRARQLKGEDVLYKEVKPGKKSSMEGLRKCRSESELKVIGEKAC